MNIDNMLKSEMRELLAKLKGLLCCVGEPETIISRTARAISLLEKVETPVEAEKKEVTTSKDVPFNEHVQKICSEMQEAKRFTIILSCYDPRGNRCEDLKYAQTTQSEALATLAKEKPQLTVYHTYVVRSSTMKRPDGT